MLTDAPSTIAAGPDFRHIHTWLFDLDNTLYRADCNLFSQIDERMTNFIAKQLSMPIEQAQRLQQSYYREYGTTLGGLTACHGIDPEAFLAYVHDIDLSVLKPDAGLIEVMARLPGRRFVFTNGCRHHASRVLERIGLSETIDGIWDIRALAYTPKPFAAAYRRLVAKAGIVPKSTAMFEDMARNLVAAHALGMTTVWLNNGSQWSHQGPQFPMIASSHIHHETGDLADFLRAIRI